MKRMRVGKVNEQIGKVSEHNGKTTIDLVSEDEDVHVTPPSPKGKMRARSAAAAEPSAAAAAAPTFAARAPAAATPASAALATVPVAMPGTGATASPAASRARLEEAQALARTAADEETLEAAACKEAADAAAAVAAADVTAAEAAVTSAKAAVTAAEANLTKAKAAAGKTATEAKAAAERVKAAAEKAAAEKAKAAAEKATAAAEKAAAVKSAAEKAAAEKAAAEKTAAEKAETEKVAAGKAAAGKAAAEEAELRPLVAPLRLSPAGAETAASTVSTSAHAAGASAEAAAAVGAGLACKCSAEAAAAVGAGRSSLLDGDDEMEVEEEVGEDGEMEVEEEVGEDGEMEVEEEDSKDGEDAAAAAADPELLAAADPERLAVSSVVPCSRNDKSVAAVDTASSLRAPTAKAASMIISQSDLKLRAKNEAREARARAGMASLSSGAGGSASGAGSGTAHWGSCSTAGGAGAEESEGVVALDGEVMICAAEPQDDLADLLYLLDPGYAPRCHARHDSKATAAMRKRVEKAAQLRELLLEQPRWHALASAPLEQLPTSAVADPPITALDYLHHAVREGVAVLLRGAASELWNTGSLEDRLQRAGPGEGPEKLHAVLLTCQSKSSSSEEVKDDAEGSMRLAGGQGSWLHLPRTARPRACKHDTQQLVKLLHVQVRQPAFPALETERLVHPPSAVQCANWVGGERGAYIQMVHARQDTTLHRDNNGTDTWMRLLYGKVLVACWSQADGAKFGLQDARDRSKVEMDWRTLQRMPSARLFLLRPSDTLLLPSGTYHYVYTVETKLVVAGDFLSAVGWRRRDASVVRDREVLNMKEMAACPIGTLPVLFKRGLVDVELLRIRAESEAGCRLTQARLDELREILAWKMQLLDEDVDLESVRSALDEVESCLREFG